MTNKEALHSVANPHLKWKCVEVDSALTIIKNALDKQEPMKPDHIAEIDDNDNAMIECPMCSAGNDYSINTIKSGYCWKCGQKLEWE